MEDAPSEWDVSRIRRLVEERAQESITLEFKACDALRGEGRKENVGKHVSAFANAGGGTLIYGIKEDDDRTAIEIDEGYDPKDIKKEWLEDVIRSQIQRRIEGIGITPVWLDERKEKVLYVVEIPQSQLAPHQASNRKFYIRRNFGISEMEEYEIRDIFMRRKAPDVRLNLFLSRHDAEIPKFELDWGTPEDVHNIELNGSLANEGGGEVHYVWITLVAEERFITDEERDDVPFRQLQAKINGKNVNILRTDIKWGGPTKMPLFKTVKYQLLDEDLRIRFMRDWLDEETKPFICWEVRAAGMMPNSGWVELRGETDGVVLREVDPKEITEVLQDGRNRDMFRKPNLSLNPNMEEGQ